MASINQSSWLLLIYNTLSKAEKGLMKVQKDEQKGYMFDIKVIAYGESKEALEDINGIPFLTIQLKLYLKYLDLALVS